MVHDNHAPPIYYVLLIGINDYQEPANKLKGCVNDIIAVEELLRQAVDNGLVEGQLRLTKLIAPREDDQIAAGAPAAENLPDRDNIIRELRRLGGNEVGQGDKVLVYYSGHGYQWQPQWTTVQHEALVTRDAQVLYDVELNALLNNIATRTTDLTVMLDCCHSEGTFRDLDLSDRSQADVQDRVMTPRAGNGPSGVDQGRGFPMPDKEIVGPSQIATTSRPGAHMLENLDPNYIVLVACRAEEKAREGRIGANPYHGAFTYGFMQVLNEIRTREPGFIKEARWADIWSALLFNVNNAGRELGNVQHPFSIGRQERRVFGGKWDKQDAGIPVHRNDDGQTYTISAGTLSGITEGALLAIYGRDEPRFFGNVRVGSQKEMQLRWGTLRVTQTDRATSTAVPEGSPPAGEFPRGARARLIAAGAGAKLRVRLADPDPDLESALGRSSLLELLPPDEKDWEIEVVARPGGGWSLNDLLTKDLAIVPADAVDALEAGLDAYHRYVTALRFAQNCKDPELNGSFNMVLLDASDGRKRAKIDPTNPALEEVISDSGTYIFNQEEQFCIKVENKSSEYTLHFFVLNCTGSGKVEYLGNETANPGDMKIIWQGASVSPPEPFVASTADPSRAQTDRMVVVATTREDADLHWLAMEQKVQQVIDEFGSKEGLSREARTQSQEKTLELWSAKLVPWHIKAQGLP